jgi:DNA-binding ferritin-like protein (Dps family)
MTTQNAQAIRQTTMFSPFTANVLGEKGQWREYKARARQLPPSYRTAIDALERYLKYFGTGGDGTAMYVDLIDLLEQVAADGTPIRQIVGDDPVEFIEAFVRNYPKGQWIVRERERLNNAIDRAAEGEIENERRAVR